MWASGRAYVQAGGASGRVGEGARMRARVHASVYVQARVRASGRAKVQAEGASGRVSEGARMRARVSASVCVRARVRAS